MGRERTGRNNRRGRGSRSRSKSASRKSSTSSSEEKTKKTLGDHIYYVGSAKNASDCITNTNFILNHIELTFSEGLDIAQALKDGKEYDFNAIKPKLEASTIDPDKDQAGYDLETEQLKLEFTTLLIEGRIDRFYIYFFSDL